MARTLRASLLAILVAGTLLPLAGFAALEYGALADAREGRERADLQSLALATALRADEAALRGDDPRAAAQAQAPGAFFVDANGTEWPEFREVAGTRLSGVDHARTSEGDVALVAWARVPALDADLVIAREPVAPSFATVAPLFALAGFLAAGAVVLLAFVASRVLAPVARLERASRRIAGGEWNERVEVAGPFEVKALAVAFNEMAASLQAQRARLDSMLDERTRALIDSESDLDALRFTLAHEFREPLRSLRWMADDLLERPLDPDAREAVTVLRRRIDDVDSVFRDLLRYEDVSRRDAPMERVSLEAALEAALHVAQTTGPLDVSGPTLPEVHGNLDLLRIALTEVLVNAAYYARGRDGVARVFLRTEEGSDHVVLHIDDAGPGIPHARREDAVHLFQRLRRDVPGTGAGLALARRALERHAGTLALGQAPEGGLRVTLRLPLEGARPPTTPASAGATRRF